MSVARAIFALATVTLALALPVSAGADVLTDPVNQWLPSSDKAQWTYEWTDSAYAKTTTREKYVLSHRSGSAFTLAWTTTGQGNAPGAVASSGTMDFQRTQAGLVNQSWAGTVPPAGFPILCADASGCGNSLAGSMYMVIWGSRSPTLAEPLLKGSRWSSVGGVSSDVGSTSRYIGRQTLLVPAFPHPVRASVVESQITQGGALGDPYGSGTRTVWWVRGVGPVKVVFRHTGGEYQQALLDRTTVQPVKALPDVNYLPLVKGDTQRFRWRNSKHMKQWSRQALTVSAAVNGTSRIDVKNLSGPIKLVGAYTFTTRIGGVTNLQAATSAASKAKFPRLGPSSAPKSDRRHFFTPLDFMVYGFNPVLPGYPATGEAWKSVKRGSDYKIFGVTGSSKVLGIHSVHTPAGRFRALEVESKLSQRGFAFGSGTRKSWFAPGKGLVKLVFKHRDGSTSTIERVR